MVETVEPLDMALLIDRAVELAELINQSREVNAYLSAKERMEADPEVRRLKRLFQRKKEQYEDVQRFGKYHPDFERVSREVRELMRDLDLLDAVREFKRAEAALDELLYQVGRTLADAVSPEIKVQSNNPFREALAVGCGAGGSCGCKTPRNARS